MAVGILERSMAKKAGRPKGERDDVSCKISRAIIAKAKLIAAHRNVTVAELLSGMLENPIDRDYLQVMEEVKANSKKPKGT